MPNQTFHLFQQRISLRYGVTCNGFDPTVIVGWEMIFITFDSDASKARNLWTGPAALSRALRLMVPLGHLYTLGLKVAQDSSECPEKLFGGSISLKASKLSPKRTEIFGLALKKISFVYFFMGQTKYFGSFWTQLWSLQWYGSPKRFLWTLRWVLGDLQTQCDVAPPPKKNGK